MTRLRTPDPEEHPRIADRTRQLPKSRHGWARRRIAKPGLVLYTGAPFEEGYDEFGSVLNELPCRHVRRVDPSRERRAKTHHEEFAASAKQRWL